MAKKRLLFDPNKSIADQLAEDDDGNLDYFELGATLAPFGPEYAEKEDQIEFAKALRGGKGPTGRHVRDFFVASSPLEHLGSLGEKVGGMYMAKEGFGELGESGQRLQAALLRTINSQRGRRRNNRLLELMPTEMGPPVDEEGNPLIGPFGGT